MFLYDILSLLLLLLLLNNINNLYNDKLSRIDIFFMTILFLLNEDVIDKIAGLNLLNTFMNSTLIKFKLS